MLKYMRIPSTAGTRDPERSRFFHKLSREPHASEHSGATPAIKDLPSQVVSQFEFRLPTHIGHSTIRGQCLLRGVLPTVVVRYTISLGKLMGDIGYPALSGEGDSS